MTSISKVSPRYPDCSQAIKRGRAADDLLEVTRLRVEAKVAICVRLRLHRCREHPVFHQGGCTGTLIWREVAKNVGHLSAVLRSHKCLRVSGGSTATPNLHRHDKCLDSITLRRAANRRNRYRYGGVHPKQVLVWSEIVHDVVFEERCQSEILLGSRRRGCVAE